MVRQALAPGLAALVIAVVGGWALGSAGAAASAGVGVALVLGNFAAHGLSLAWAATVSVTALVGVALGGFVLRLGVLVAAMAMLNELPWFSPVAFGLTVMPATLLLLSYEARLAARGFETLQVPPDAVASAAAASRADRRSS